MQANMLHTVLVSVILTVVKRTKRRYQQLCHYSREEETYKNWNEVPIGVKFHFFSFWYFLNFISCVIIMTSCILGLAEEFGYSTSAWYMIVYGFGCMLSCLNMMRCVARPLLAGMPFLIDIATDTWSTTRSFICILRRCATPLPILSRFVCRFPQSIGLT